MITATIIQNPNEIQSGDNTHHHDHVATIVVPVSFKIINTIVNNPANPIPPDEEDEEDELLIVTYIKRESI